MQPLSAIWRAQPLPLPDDTPATMERGPMDSGKHVHHTSYLRETRLVAMRCSLRWVGCPGAGTRIGVRNCPGVGSSARMSTYQATSAREIGFRAKRSLAWTHSVRGPSVNLTG